MVLCTACASSNAQPTQAPSNAQPTQAPSNSQPTQVASNSQANQASSSPQAAQAPGASPVGAQAATSPVSVSAAAASPSSVASPPPVAAAAASTSASGGDLRTLVRQVAQQVRPAIVQITNLQQQQQQGVPGQIGGGAAVPAGVGSGVIYDSQGHILTNNHVIAGAQQLEVSLPDRRSFPAKLTGADPQTDLAVLQIEGDNLPVAQLGDSNQLQVGDWVVAIGNALALPGGPTVTQGVVSALNRTVQEPGDTPNTSGPFLFNAIQTDAPINPGNSGGALVNLENEVIGINTLVAGQAEPGVSAQGIGFAIAIATAKPIADQLVSTGRAVHPFLGVQYGPLTPAIAAQLSAGNVQNGAVIGAVQPGSPAATAGLQPRDIITAVDGQPLVAESSLAQMLSQHQPGDQVTLSVVRGGQLLQVQVTLGQAPS
ncbi:MAG: trypsin-like peptidase domain-containing protein [Chloroflexi bacterium]|nr:trypsin-like peptidase domain-containing protein [Chloroflexota bacterium]